MQGNRWALPVVLPGIVAGQGLSSMCLEVLERHSDTEEVTGSNPVRPTVFRARVRRKVTTDCHLSRAGHPLNYAVRRLPTTSGPRRSACLSSRVPPEAADLARSTVPDEMADRGFLRPLADNTAGIATWRRSGRASRAYLKCPVDAIATTRKSSSVVTAQGEIPPASKPGGSASSPSRVRSRSVVTPP